MARETFKDIELGGRKWRLNKVNALVGSNILRKFVGFDDPQRFMATLSDDDFSNIQRDLLLAVQEVIEKGAALQVMMPDGRIGVEDIPSGTLYMLTIGALQFNLSGFFDERASKDFKQVSEALNS